MPYIAPEYAFRYTRVWFVLHQRCVQLAQPHLQNCRTHSLHQRQLALFQGRPIFSPVFDVHAPEVVVKEVEDRRLPESIFVRHNRRHVVVDEVSVDGVAVDDHRDEGDEGAVDKVLEVDETIGRLRL